MADYLIPLSIKEQSSLKKIIQSSRESWAAGPAKAEPFLHWPPRIAEGLMGGTTESYIYPMK